MKKIILGVIAVGLLLGSSSIFVVDEGKAGIVVQFGKVKRIEGSGLPVVYEPGLHWKWPLIDEVRRLDSRIQTMDGQADRFVTSEKKDLIIDSYVKWRIEDFAKFFLATGGGNYAQAENLLKRKISNGLRSEIGSRTISDIVSGQRSEVMEDTLKKMASSSELGIKVVMSGSSRSTCRWRSPTRSTCVCAPSVMPWRGSTDPGAGNRRKFSRRISIAASPS